ncbi:MAG: hypothetical protein MUC43_00410 [Pirellula sp.]|nr:hypothetical protein [Pirellula sp.]
MSKPHCIELLHVKAWTHQEIDHGVCWVRSFGAPPNVKNATRTNLCISGDWLPKQIVLNGLLAITQTDKRGQMRMEIGRQLVERNKVELIWVLDKSSEATDSALASLSSVHLEIWE